MKHFNLQKIRQLLPLGSIKRISEVTGMPPFKVGAILNKGWYPERRDEVVVVALDIIESTVGDKELMERADSLGLTQGIIRVPEKRKKSSQADNEPITMEDLRSLDREELQELAAELGVETGGFLISKAAIRDDIAEALGFVDEDDEDDD